VNKKLLEVQEIRFRYNSAFALKDLSFELTAGEMIAIIGPNGSGKSTLLKCVSGLFQPEQGNITLAGKNIFDYTARERARRVAVVPQETALAFDLTVAEAVLMGRQPHLKPFQRETPADVAKVEAALEQTGIRSLSQRSVPTLSGGERQRMLIARALAQEPQLLILDEPTSQLDITYQGEILGLLQRLNSHCQVAALVAIHDLNLAVQYFDRFILLAQGRILAQGRAAEVVTDENLRQAYASRAVEIIVNRHPVHQRPFVTVYPKQQQAFEPSGRKKGAVE